MPTTITQHSSEASSSVSQNVFVAEPFTSGILPGLYGDPSVTAKLNKPITEFTGKTDVNIWFTKLELLLENQAPKPLWLGTALSWIGESCLKDIPELQEIKASPNGYNILKERLIKKILWPKQE